MYKNLLVPLDTSALAEGILCQVEDLAKMTGAEISLLRVVNIRAFPGADMKAIEGKAVQRAEEYLGGVAKTLSDKGFTVTTHVRIGKPAEEILAHAEKYADLVVMTTHGRSGLGRWALGSVADRVINQSEKPVLLFRADESCEV